MGTPSAPALSQSTSIRYWGTSSRPLGRTERRRWSCEAMYSSWLRAAVRAWWPTPPRSSSCMSKPWEVPSSGIAGGANTNTMALRIRDSSCMARAATALAFSSFLSRSSQSRSLTKAMPWFCPRPAMLMPSMAMNDSAASCSCRRHMSVMDSATSPVCSRVEFGGSTIWQSRIPWSSSGR